MDCLPTVLVEEILEHAGPTGWLVAAQCDKSFNAMVGSRLASGTISVTGCAQVATDEWLLFLLKRLPRGSLTSLNISGCKNLTKSGILKALRGGRAYNLEQLNALNVGMASWNVRDLRRLIDLCPSLTSLRADCRAKGVDADQLGALIDECAIQPRKLFLHHGAAQPLLESGTVDATPTWVAPPTPLPAVVSMAATPSAQLVQISVPCCCQRA